MKNTTLLRTIPLALAWALLSTLTLSGCINSHDSESADNAAQGSGGDASDTDHDASGSHSINGSIHVSAGTPGGEVSTINGSIHADDNAQLSGGHTVNGNISIGDHATATSLTTVNGGISLGQGAKVTETVTTVNGTLALRSGSEVGGRLANVNGTIILAAATVNGGITTVNGNIDVGANSHVQGGITVHKPSTGFFQWWSDSDKPRVVIGPGSVVEGNLTFERAVHLYVSDSATIGKVTGATPVKFTGDHPPAG
jgi:cytoskeletal protein CcmA (bactofilin family)